jgi:anaerobic magnesium-protoporphyrin IX monomethyl ester cyclase
MRVLLTHSYFLKFDPKQWRQMQPYAPLGTLYAASVLRRNGFDIALHDVMFADTPASIAPLLASFKPDVLVIYDDSFNYLSKMCLTNMRNAAFEMARLGKESGCTVIVSSSDATDHYGEYLDKGADFILIGEGEETLPELASALKSGDKDFRQIDGIVYQDTVKGMIRTLPRKVMHDLDALPDPAWDLVNIDQYRQAWLSSTGYFSINMSTTRGCPFKCNWCAKPIYGNRYNVRSPENVVAELMRIKEQFHFDHVWFCDDIFGLKPGWIKRFSELVKEHGLEFSFKIQSRADLLLKDEQIGPLAAAGCQTVWIGAESGSQKILDAMDKGITTAQIREATMLLRKHGIKVAYFLQFAYLGETMNDITKTLEMLHDNMPDDIGISVSYPLPGTKFYDMVKEQLKQKANWTDSDDLALMFRNNYDAVFYRSLHKYVHVYFRKLKAASDNTFSIKGMMRIPYYALQERWQRRSINRR